MKRLFIYDKLVQAIIRDLSIDEQQVIQMENEIMLGYGDVVPNTAGIRKIRCGITSRGKRGGIRILFADYPQVNKTYLLTALQKNQRANFSQQELKILRQLKRQLDKLNEVQK